MLVSLGSFSQCAHVMLLHSSKEDMRNSKTLAVGIPDSVGTEIIIRVGKV